MEEEFIFRCIKGLTCEESACGRHAYDGVRMFWYQDLGAWTRVFCEEHVPKDEEGLKYGAKEIDFESFIHQALKAQMSDLRKEVEKKKTDPYHCGDVHPGKCDCSRGRDEALDEVLLLMKKV